MKTTLRHTLQTLALTIGITALTCPASQAAAQDTWQERLLFDPPQSQLKLEKRGRVMIYDGLTDRQVLQAMDAQFNRIQSMMFVRTVMTNTEGDVMHDDATGQVMVEDDGCDD